MSLVILWKTKSKLHITGPVCGESISQLFLTVTQKGLLWGFIIRNIHAASLSWIWWLHCFFPLFCECRDWKRLKKKAMKASHSNLTTPCNSTHAHIDGLVQDCSSSSAVAMELLQSCIKPSIYFILFIFYLSVLVSLAPTSVVHASTAGRGTSSWWCGGVGVEGGSLDTHPPDTAPDACVQGLLC